MVKDGAISGSMSITSTLYAESQLGSRCHHAARRVL